jgi:glycerol-3-phosphate dehydrogenase
MDYQQFLVEAYPGLRLECAADRRGILTLTGECESWEQLVGAGHAAAKLDGVKNVVSEMTVRGLAVPKKDYTALKRAGEAIGVVGRVDVLIVGAGISGCGIARELAKYDLDILVIDKGEDVATGATKANNGNIHPGHDVTPGTLKAKLNVKGNRMYAKWALELGFELQRCGAMGAVTDRRLMPALEAAYEKAVANGVDGAELVGAERAYELEPGLARNGDHVAAALWLPSMALVEPYRAAAALAENAAGNGARFWFNCTAAGILHSGGAVRGAVTDKGIVLARYIVNCAGVYADEISAMAGDKSYTIHARRGVIAILDKNRAPVYGSLTQVVDMGTAAAKNENSKGGGMCRTPEGNVLMGPSAKEIPDKEDVSVTPEELAYAMGRGARWGIGYGDVIRSFAGIRPAEFTEDFVIGMSPVTDGFINVGGIQSPGLAAAPAIAEMVEGILAESARRRGTPLAPRAGYNPMRKREIEFRRLSRGEQRELVGGQPCYGKVICRCETVTEGEILAALRSPVPPASIGAVKRRTRAGMGRCQGGFCQCQVLDILARELGRGKAEIDLEGEGSHILLSRTK